MSINARTNIAWTVAIGSAIGISYVLNAIGAPDWLIGVGGAGGLIGTMLFAQWKKWIADC